MNLQSENTSISTGELNLKTKYFSIQTFMVILNLKLFLFYSFKDNLIQPKTPYLHLHNIQPSLVNVTLLIPTIIVIPI
jgi:uncharacterized membrane protein YedE/YeeE